MIPSAYRLRSRKSFDVIYKRGKSVANDHLVLLTLPGRNSNPKVGFVVGKKVGKAVCRNKVKRRLREIFRSLIGRVQGHTSYVVVARSSAARVDSAVLESDLIRLLQRADKLKP